jgi:hypothetical protein
MSASRDHGPSAFSKFMASAWGRGLRVILGAAIGIAGLAFVDAPGGYLVAAAGLLPIATGVFGLCPIAPLWGGHFLGSRYCAAHTNTGSDR